MRQAFGEITANLELAPTTHILRIQAPEIAPHAIPGQFVHVRCTQGAAPLLRRPFSIMRLLPSDDMTANMQRDELALLIETVGQGSAILAKSTRGDRVDILGPLGRGFAIHPKTRQILLIAGGIGVAPLIALAHEALAKDIAVTLVFGARTAGKVFPAGLLPAEVEYVVYTEDGSAGRRGLVTESVQELLPWADQVFACGPHVMLRAIAKIVEEQLPALSNRVPAFAQASLEQHMGCAMGACYGCVIDTVKGRQRVCKDGPVFDFFEVEWM